MLTFNVVLQYVCLLSVFGCAAHLSLNGFLMMWLISTWERGGIVVEHLIPLAALCCVLEQGTLL